MKNPNFLLGVISTICAFLLISSNRNSSTDDDPRFHIEVINENQAIIYESKTGDYSKISLEFLSSSGNLQD